MSPTLLVFAGTHGTGKTSMANLIARGCSRSRIVCSDFTVLRARWTRLLLRLNCRECFQSKLYSLTAFVTLIGLALSHVHMMLLRRVFMRKERLLIEDEGYTIKAAALLIYPMMSSKHAILFRTALSLMMRSLAARSTIVYLKCDSPRTMNERLLLRDRVDYDIGYLTQMSDAYDYLIDSIGRIRKDICIMTIMPNDQRTEREVRSRLFESLEHDTNFGLYASRRKHAVSLQSVLLVESELPLGPSFEHTMTCRGMQAARDSRVLAITPSFYGSSGDAVNERQLITALASEVSRCCVITFIGPKQLLKKHRKRDGEDLPKNMIVIALPFSQPNLLLSCIFMISISCITATIALILNAMKRVDWIYVRNSLLAPGFLSLPTLARRTVVKIPAIIEDEVPCEGLTKVVVSELVSVLDRLALAKAKRVAVIGVELYYRVTRRRSLAHRSEPIELTPGIDRRLIEKVRSCSGLRKTWTVGFVGTLEWWQGPRLLVEGFALAAKKLANLKLLVIGDGPLRKEVERACLQADVEYEITGYLPHEEALKRLQSLDMMILPSLEISTTESHIPIKVIEAWALGIPVIVTRHKVLTDRYQDAEDVLYCDPLPKDIARCIAVLAKDKVLRLRLTERGPNLAKEFDYSRIAQKLVRAFMGD